MNQVKELSTPRYDGVYIFLLNLHIHQGTNKDIVRCGNIVIHCTDDGRIAFKRYFIIQIVNKPFYDKRCTITSTLQCEVIHFAAIAARSNDD